MGRAELICRGCATSGANRKQATALGGAMAVGAIGSLLALPMAFGVPLFGGLLVGALLAGNRRVCAECGSRDLIPTSTPAGRKLAEAIRGEAQG